MWFVVPGPLDQITGGYLFDKRVVEGLRKKGRRVEVIELEGAFPAGGAAGRRAMRSSLEALPAAAAVAVDGLALAGLEHCFDEFSKRLRLVAFVHHPLALETGLTEEERQKFATLERELLPRFRGVLCPSSRTAAEMRAYGVRLVEITPPGIDKHDIRAGFRAEGPAQLLCVGTLTPRKGHLVLIEALALCRDLDWQLTCIGSLDTDPVTVRAVRARIDAAQLAARIRLAGEWPPARLGEAYAEADLFVLPSFHEGYGMAFAEAMAAGLPVIATRAGAIPETVPESAGILVPPGNPIALAGALRAAIGDASLRSRLAAGARAHAAALPSWDDAVERWGAAFDRLSA